MQTQDLTRLQLLAGVVFIFTSCVIGAFTSAKHPRLCLQTVVMAAVEAKRPKPLHAVAQLDLMSSATTEAEHEEVRKRRHRETEKQRRQRTKAAVDQLRHLCETEAQAERVIVLEQAVNTVQRLQEQVMRLEQQLQGAKLADFASNTSRGSSSSRHSTTADLRATSTASPESTTLLPFGNCLADPGLFLDDSLHLPMPACTNHGQDCCGSMADDGFPDNSWLSLPSPTSSLLFDFDSSIAGTNPCLRGLVLQSVLDLHELGIVQAYVGRLDSLEEIIAQHVQGCRCGTCLMARLPTSTACSIFQGALHATPAQLQAELDLYQRQRAVSLDLYTLSNPVPLLAISARGMYVDINQAACTQLETSSAEVVGKFMWELPISPDWRIRASESRGMASGSVTTLVTVERLRTVRTRTVIWIRQTLISQSTAVNVHGGAAPDAVHYALCMLQTVEAPRSGSAHVVACM
jgi:PAS domain-containing protein